MADRDDLRRDSLFQKAKLEELPDAKFVFRRVFKEGKDEYIVKNLLNYFGAVSSKWSKSWNEKSGGNILNKSTGLLALMRLYRDIVNQIGRYDIVISEAEFFDYFRKIDLADESFDKATYIPGTSGQSLLYHKMLSFIERR